MESTDIQQRGRAMTDRPISTETHYVATMMAYIALQSLTLNLVAYLEGGDAPLDELMGRAVETAAIDHEVTDLPAGSYDVDMAQEIALDMLARTFGLIREVVAQ